MPLDESIHSRIERERKAAQPDAELVRVYRDYARGRQPGTLNAGQQRILAGLTNKRGARFCDNVCKMVLIAIVGRVQLVRYAVAHAATEKWLQDWWTHAGLPVLQGRMHWATPRDGNAAIALAWDRNKGQARAARERWWDGKTGLWVAYDDADQPTYAVKDWKAVSAAGQPIERRVIWYPDAIERYMQDGAGWRPFPLDPAAPASWREPWVDQQGKPLGLPVVHFANAYLPQDGDDTDATYGTSELDGGVLGLQDEINDVQRDITAAARLTAYQMLWGSGVVLAKDNEGNDIPLRVEPGTILTTSDPAGRYGAIPAGSIQELERTLHIKLQAVSRATSTPIHLITGGDWPSGEALLRADKPLSNKAAAMDRAFGPPWASLAHKATLLANAFGGQSLDTDSLITAVFAPTDDPDKLKAAQIADAIAPYVSEAEILRVLLYGPDEIAKIKVERAADRAAAEPPSSSGITSTGAQNLAPVGTAGSNGAGP